MPADRRKIARLRRLERVRAIAHQEAASAAAEAEATLARLDDLASRTDALAGDYAARAGISDGGELCRTGQFVHALLSIRAAAMADAQRARTLADARQNDLANAERRRAGVQDRADAAERALAQRSAQPVLAARRKAGTGLE